MDLADGTEDHVPVWSAEIRRCAETGDGVRVAAVEDDVGGVGGGDLGGKILGTVVSVCRVGEVGEMAS